MLPGSGIIVPKAHRPSPFDFTPEEWAATHSLLLKACPRCMHTSTSSLGSMMSRCATVAVGGDQRRRQYPSSSVMSRKRLGADVWARHDRLTGTERRPLRLPGPFRDRIWRPYQHPGRTEADVEVNVMA